MLPPEEGVVKLPALELAFHTPGGAPIDVTVNGTPSEVLLGADGWLEVPLPEGLPSVLTVQASDRTGHSIERVVQLEGGRIELD